MPGIFLDTAKQKLVSLCIFPTAENFASARFWIDTLIKQKTTSKDDLKILLAKLAEQENLYQEKDALLLLRKEMLANVKTYLSILKERELVESAYKKVKGDIAAVVVGDVSKNPDFHIKCVDSIKTVIGEIAAQYGQSKSNFYLLELKEIQNLIDFECIKREAESKEKFPLLEDIKKHIATQIDRISAPKKTASFANSEKGNPATKEVEQGKDTGSKEKNIPTAAGAPANVSGNIRTVPLPQNKQQTQQKTGSSKLQAKETDKMNTGQLPKRKVDVPALKDPKYKPRAIKRGGTFTKIVQDRQQDEGQGTGIERSKKQASLKREGTGDPKVIKPVSTGMRHK